MVVVVDQTALLAALKVDSVDIDRIPGHMVVRMEDSREGSRVGKHLDQLNQGLLQKPAAFDIISCVHVL